MKQSLLEVLVAISERMNEGETDLDRCLTNILEISMKYLHVKRISLMLIEHGTLVMKAHVGIYDKSIKDLVIPLGVGISGSVALKGEPVIMNDVVSTKVDGSYSARSFMSFPLKVRENIVGVLNLTDKEDDHFSDDDTKIGLYISSQCALAIERYNLYKEAISAENLKIIGRMRSSFAHDIKNMINVISIYLELLQEVDIENEEAKEYIEFIYTEVKRIYGLSMDLLEFSKQEISLQKGHFLLEDVLEEVYRHVSVRLRDTGVKLEYKAEKNLFLDGDRDKLFRVFFNLVNNSVDAVDERDGWIQLVCKRVGDRVSVRVADNGKGISPSIIHDIFNPFTTSGKVGGTGLGLSIVKEIISAHRGTVAVRSTLGRYTIFVVKLELFHACDNI